MSSKAEHLLQKQASPALVAASLYVIKVAEKKENNSIVKSLIPGAAAGALSTIVTAPLDRIKDNMTQMSNAAANAIKEFKPQQAEAYAAEAKNVFTSAKGIYKSHGAKGFYKGLTGSMVKMPLAMGVTFAASDYLKRKMENKNG